MRPHDVQDETDESETDSYRVVAYIIHLLLESNTYTVSRQLCMFNIMIIVILSSNRLWIFFLFHLILIVHVILSYYFVSTLTIFKCNDCIRAN